MKEIGRGSTNTKYIVRRNDKYYCMKKSSALSHADRENHKYIAKVKQSNGKYRYFYDKEEYMKFLKNGESTIKKLGDKLKSGLTDLKKLSQKGKDYTEKISDKKMNSIFFLISRKTVKRAVDWVLNKFGKKDEKYDNGKTDALVTDREKPGHKYIAKVKTPNGKYRYFYSPDEYDAYLKRREYQKNEPDFMKHVANISVDDIYSSKEDMEKVNEVYSPYDKASSTNCGNCSAAYELRRRGYDVEAKMADKSYNGDGSRVYDYFEKPEKLYVYEDGKTGKANEKFERKIWKTQAVWTSDEKISKDGYKFYTTKKHKYTSEGIEKAIKSNNPPGSRGFIDVTWKEGGGHSIVYEVDKKGKVTIKDSQTYDTYDVSELADKVSHVSITRTDNLKLKKDILNTVKTNTDKERTYYVDQNVLRRYDE